MAEQLAVEVDVKNVTHTAVHSSSSSSTQQEDKPIYFVWITQSFLCSCSHSAQTGSSGILILPPLNHYLLSFVFDCCRE